MSFIARLQRAREILEQQGRLSIRAVARELEIGDEELAEIVEELVDAQQVARRDGKVLVWVGPSTPQPSAARPMAANPTPNNLSPASDHTEARKVVTILFADLARSTALHERLDPESVRRFMETYYGAMRRAVEEHGGTVVKFLGDGVMAAFGVPRVAEDDAIRAVRSGVAMQQAFSQLAQAAFAAVGDIGLRVGINTGEVVVSADNADVVGDPVNVSARLQAEAHDGEVVIGEPTRRLVESLVTLAPLGSVALKGRTEAMKAYRVESLDRPVAATTAAFVGRDGELGRITAVYDAAVAEPATRLAVLLGSPGLGKSRLIEEFTRRLRGTASVITAQCDAEGGATFAPVAEALREFLAQLPLLTKEGAGVVGTPDRTPPNPVLGKEGGSGPSLHSALEAVLPSTDSDRTRIINGITLLLAGSPASPEETFFVIRRFLAALAAVRPVVLVIDDLQWAEPLLLDLVEHLVQWGSRVPLLILIGARPELRDTRSSLATSGGFVADVVTLGGLDAGAAMRLAASVIGAADLPAAVAAKVLATSEGNPLFVAELVRMLVQEGALRQEGERWTTGAGLADLEMPPTIHALLAARIERLRPDERSVLERAAVIGRHFSRSAVAALLPTDAGQLDARLEGLRRSELIEPDGGWFLGEPVLRFHHILIRDAAYRRLLKGTRAELHERLADWIESRAPDAVEHDETLGWHLEQAHQLLGELGPVDARGRVLGERAARHLAAAGQRALAREDLPVAADLLGRALGRLEGDDPARASLALDWCEALLAAGDVGPAVKAIAELERLIVPLLGKEGPGVVGTPDRPPPHPLLGKEGEAGRSPTAIDMAHRLSAWHTCFVGQLTVLTAPQELQATAAAVAGAAEELAKLGDAAGEAKAHSVHAQALARLGKVGGCEAALDKALAAARQAGDRRRANAVLAGAPLAALWGPSPVTRASGRCLDVVRVLRITQGAPAVESVALSCQAVLEALRGRTEAARRMLASSRKMVEELGIAHRLFEADAFSGRIAAMEGDTAAAEGLLRGAYDGLRNLGLGIDAARAGALLARTLLAQDRVGEAEALSHESETLAGDDLQAAIAWRGVRAEALAKRGERGAAIELAEAAVAIASATDALLDHADARMALAAALRAAGREREADTEVRHAIELWEAKGATLLADRARSQRQGTAPAVSTAEPATTRPPAVRRRVWSNAATAMQARFDVALAARDFNAIAALFRADHQEIDHPTGSTYGRDACIASLRRLFRSRDPHYEVEPLATLGESLLLIRRRLRASGTTSGRYDVGAYENEAIQLFEVDGGGLCRHSEVFAADHLNEAIARLYSRYAELLPGGTERERARATARSFSVLLNSPGDIDGHATVIAPDFESVDYRQRSTWSMRGGGAFLAHMRALREVAADITIGTHDVPALAPGALLIQRMHVGTERLGGGPYERSFLAVFATDAEGRLSRAEWFDDDREAEALARFEALVAAAEPKRAVRRLVRANAATTHLERESAALEARDPEALAAANSGDLEVIHHPTGAVYGADAVLAMHRQMWRAKNLQWSQELLATLGDSLALVRRSYSHDGVDSKFGSIGAAEGEYVIVFEVDERAQAKRSEVFAGDRLADAVVRLYQRYAALLPDGPERDRAAAVAVTRSDTAAPDDLERFLTRLAPGFEGIDHRRFGTWSMRGAAAYIEHLQALRQVGDQIVFRWEDVLALTPSASLVRTMHSGTERLGGGIYERAFLTLFVTGADGRYVRAEWFDDDREAEALARFEGLVGDGEAETPYEPFANAASRTDSELFRCFNRRDWEGVLSCVAPVMVFDERRRLARNTCGRDVWLEQFRLLFDVPKSRFTSRLRATRGERLALNFHRFEGEVAEGGGPLAMEDHLALHEVDADGRIVGLVLFDLDDEAAAHAELEARFEAGEAATFPHVVQALGTSRLVRTRHWPEWVAAQAPGFRYRDHRQLGFGDTVGDVNALLRLMQSTVDLAPDVRYRDDHVRISARGILRQVVLVGTREGGLFENPMLLVAEVDAQGRIARTDSYDIGDREPALARFAELAAPPVAVVSWFENAASRAWWQVIDIVQRRDVERFAAIHPPAFRYRDHRRLVQLDLDRDAYLAFARPLLEMRSTSAAIELLSTRGDRLALVRPTLVMADDSAGPSAVESLLLIETGEDGAIVAYDRYELDDEDVARTEIQSRWEFREGSQLPAMAWMRGHGESFARRDWDGLAELYSPDIVGHDHRLVGWGTLRGRANYLQSLRSMETLSPDARIRADHTRACAHGLIGSNMWVGTRDGGVFESPFLFVSELDADGRAVRIDLYDPQHVERAQERFAAIAASGAQGIR